MDGCMPSIPSYPLDGYLCNICKQFHPNLPISYGYNEPNNYIAVPVDERQHRAILGPSQCVIDQQQYFVRGLIELPIIGLPEMLLWGVWATVWKEDFIEIDDHWQIQGREKLIG